MCIRDSDTREADKYAECHIEGAINIPQIDLPDMNHLITKEMPVIIYCLYGVKSQAPYLYLTEKLKYKNIYVLEGGIYQWACLLYTSPSPRDGLLSRMPSSA